jgi:hypothetical protein
MSLAVQMLEKSSQGPRHAVHFREEVLCGHDRQDGGQVTDDVGSVEQGEPSAKGQG